MYTIPSPIYVPSDTSDDDVEHIPKHPVQPLSDNVRISMQQLNLRNVILEIPSFLTTSPHSLDDKHVASTIHHIYRSQPHTNHNAVLVLTTNSTKANRWYKLLTQQTQLLSYIHISQTPSSLHPLFRDYQVVITTVQDFYDSCRPESLSLTRLSLIVVDVAEKIYSSHHAVAFLIRDHYRALPPPRRPKILAIAREQVSEIQRPPMEYNLMSRFVSVKVSNDHFWQSTYGRSCRKPENGLFDIETLYYQTPADQTVNFSDRKHPTVTNIKRDRRAYSQLDHVVDQVGQLGVAAYVRRRDHKKKLRTDPSAPVPPKLTVTDDIALLALTPKAMSLLNELERAFAASTTSQNLSAIIYAGRPVIACALCEVIRALPVFQTVRIRVALGIQSQDTFSQDVQDGFVDSKWQGYDTDEEEVGSFSAQETNVLIVAAPYARTIRAKSTLPATPLVMRFDGSPPNPELDALGGRCRIIIFKPHDDKRSRKRGTNDDRAGPGDPLQIDSNPNPSKAPKLNSVQPRYPSRNALHPPPINPPPPGYRGVVQVNRRDVDNAYAQATDGDTDAVRFCLPPRALVGPDCTGRTPSYFYRILAFGDQPSSREQEISDARQCGLEDFLIVLSKPMKPNDYMISLQDHVTGTGNGANISGFLKLDSQGKGCLSEEQVKLGRRYTTEMFSIMLPNVHNEHFIWDSDVAGNPSVAGKEKKIPDDRRCYLVLPSKPCEEGENTDDIMEVVPTSPKEPAEKDAAARAKDTVERYFDPTRKVEERKLTSCTIDWDSVKNFLHILDKDTYYHESRKTDGLTRESYSELQGKFVFAAHGGGLFVMCGGLRSDVSPLTSLVRSRKFPLYEDGTFQNHNDLKYLINLGATKETLAKQAVASDKNGANMDDSNLDGKSPTAIDLGEMPKSLVPARWCSTSEKLVQFAPRSSKKRKRQQCVFDCNRNVAKKRKNWVGDVRYTNETYFNSYSNEIIGDLVQPLIETARSMPGRIEHLHEIVKGTSVPALFEQLVSKGVGKALVAPELAKIFPLSVGAMFLPSALYVIEQHVSICELRWFFDPPARVQGRIGDLLQAVTSIAVNSTKNYERLELLGDALLKLSSTARLFARKPHDSEGRMHHYRQDTVSNQRLNDMAVQIQLYNYLRVQTTTVEDWRPPGTDLRGKSQKVSKKGLADVVEALCGAYCIFGAEAPRKKLEVQELDGYAKMDSDMAMARDLVTTDSEDEQEKGNDEEQNGSGEEKSSVLKEDGGKGKRKVEDNKKDPMHPFHPISVQRAYETGYRFLEQACIFDDQEPSQSEMILSAAHAMHPKNSPPPTDIDSAFPTDRRLTNPDKPWDEHYGLLERAIGYKFKRRELLLCALTHGSYASKGGRSVSSEKTFERLEFLGDAVADFCVVWFLYERYPHLGPGELTTLKGNVVSNEAFARTTVALGLHTFMHYSSSSLSREIKSFIQTVDQDLTNEDETGAHGAFKRSLGEIAAPKALGDVFESLLGAVYVDAGISQAWRTCMKLLKDSLRINGDPHRNDAHPTKELLDMCGKVWRLGVTPRYEVKDQRQIMERRGDKGLPIGSRKMATVYIMNEQVATGFGSTEKRARLKAAVNAMKFLQDSKADSEGAKTLRRLRDKGVRRRIAIQRQTR